MSRVESQRVSAVFEISMCLADFFLETGSLGDGVFLVLHIGVAPLDLSLTRFHFIDNYYIHDSVANRATLNKSKREREVTRHQNVFLRVFALSY